MNFPLSFVVDFTSWTSPATVLAVVAIVYFFGPSFVSEMRKAWAGKDVTPPDQNIAKILSLVQQHSLLLGQVAQNQLPPAIASQLIQSTAQNVQVASVLLPLAKEVKAQQQAGGGPLTSASASASAPIITHDIPMPPASTKSFMYVKTNVTPPTTADGQ